jgi:hypothetical protein
MLLLLSLTIYLHVLLCCRAFRKFSRGATKLLWPAFQTEVVALLPHLSDGDEISGIFKVE